MNADGMEGLLESLQRLVAHDKHNESIDARLGRLEKNGERTGILLEDISETVIKLLEVLAANYERQVPRETLQAWFDANEHRISALEAFVKTRF